MPPLAAWLLVTLILVFFDDELRPDQPGWAWAYEVTAAFMVAGGLPVLVAFLVLTIEGFK